jgi:hypothetical protein
MDDGGCNISIFKNKEKMNFPFSKNWSQQKLYLKHLMCIVLIQVCSELCHVSLFEVGTSLKTLNTTLSQNQRGTNKNKIK